MEAVVGMMSFHAAGLPRSQAAVARLLGKWRCDGRTEARCFEIFQAVLPFVRLPTPVVSSRGLGTLEKLVSALESDSAGRLSFDIDQMVSTALPVVPEVLEGRLPE